MSDPQCSSGTVNVTVPDTTPPAMSNLPLSSTQLWPPNHQMVDISVAYSASDLGDPAPVCSLGITSNESAAGAREIVDAHHIRLRSERDGTGNGRIYTVAATCSDASGNVAQKSATVKVPKSQGN